MFPHGASVWLLTGLIALRSVMGQTIGPSDTAPSTDSTQMGIVFGNSPRPWTTSQPPILLSSLTSTGGSLADASITGPVVYIKSTSVSNITGSVAFIQCDATTNSPSPLDIFIQVVAARPAAVVLFSTSVRYCQYTPGNFANFAATYTTINTIVSSSLGANTLDQIINPTASAGTLYSTILTRQSVANSMNGGNGTGGQNPNTGPSTAVAMIILYSITGVITALFLIIIVTGAIRAHRHPERYGPRNLMGRTRQSRARGLARAMLDTLPIVKFGEQDPPKPGEGADVEMASATGGAAAVAGTRNEPATQRTPLNRGSTGTDDSAEPRSPGIQEAPAAAAEETQDSDNLGCSICTDDFERGQDVRVLPCKHQFHPACIDPWLLNVSGTCPLCRTDLRPGTAQSNHTTTSNFLNQPESEVGSPRGSSFAPPLDESATNGRQSRRISNIFTINNLLNPQRMQEASREERIAALRRVREQRASTGEDEIEARRRRRLTARLHDAFHIRTRARSGSRSRTESPGPADAAGVSAANVPGISSSAAAATTDPAVQARDHALHRHISEERDVEAGADVRQHHGFTPALHEERSPVSPLNESFEGTSSSPGTTQQSQVHRDQ